MKSNITRSDYHEPCYQRAIAMLREEIECIEKLANAEQDADLELAENMRSFGHAAREKWPKRVAGQVNITDLADAVYNMLTEKEVGEGGTNDAAAIPDRAGIALAFGRYCREELEWRKTKTTSVMCLTVSHVHRVRRSHQSGLSDDRHRFNASRTVQCQNNNHV